MRKRRRISVRRGEIKAWRNPMGITTRFQIYVKKKRRKRIIIVIILY